MFRKLDPAFLPLFMLACAITAAGAIVSCQNEAKAAQPAIVHQLDTTQVLPYRNAYTVHIVNDLFNKQTGFDVLLMDGNRVVTVIKLDSTCHLAKAILEDNL